MSTATKILAGTALGAGVLAAVNYFKNIKRAQVHLQVIPSAMIHQVSLEGLTIRVDALLKNPTDASFKVKYPFVEIIHKDVLVGSSQVVNQDIKIPAFGQALIQGMMVQIPIMSFFSVVYDMVKALMNKQSIVLTVAVISTVDLGWTKVPYESKRDLTLKK